MIKKALNLLLGRKETIDGKKVILEYVLDKGINSIQEYLPEWDYCNVLVVKNGKFKKIPSKRTSSYYFCARYLDMDFVLDKGVLKQLVTYKYP